jgi:hypothetical protein
MVPATLFDTQEKMATTVTAPTDAPLPSKTPSIEAKSQPVTPPNGSETLDAPQPTQNEDNEPAVRYSWRFWLIFPALCITAFLASLEGTVVSTALPTINQQLNTGDNYVWVINAFFLTRFDPFNVDMYPMLMDMAAPRFSLYTANLPTYSAVVGSWSPQ